VMVVVVVVVVVVVAEGVAVGPDPPSPPPPQAASTSASRVMPNTSNVIRLVFIFYFSSEIFKFNVFVNESSG